MGGAGKRFFDKSDGARIKCCDTCCGKRRCMCVCDPCVVAARIRIIAVPPLHPCTHHGFGLEQSETRRLMIPLLHAGLLRQTLSTDTLPDSVHPVHRCMVTGGAQAQQSPQWETHTWARR